VPPAGVFSHISMKIGIVSSAPARLPAIITGLRPIRSESAPKTMKNGVAMASATTMIQLVSSVGTCPSDVPRSQSSA
jgi:hypothetical protein